MKKAVLAGVLSTAVLMPPMAHAADQVHATGTIAVSKYEPQPYDVEAEPKLNDIHVEETFSGDIVGNGTARFLQAQSAVGSASFTGLERFVGELNGKKGSFVLQDVGALKGDVVEGT